MRNIECDVSIKEFTTIKVGGIARWFIDVSSIEDIRYALCFAKNKNINYFIIGNGSNLLINDGYFDGLVIRINNKFNDINFGVNVVEVESGCLLSTFINKCRELSFSCIEKLYGIPGTIGGSVYGNAGVKDLSIGDKIISVKVLEDGIIKEYSKEECDFGYRDSIFKRKNCVILSAKLRIDAVNKSIIDYCIRDTLKYRKEKQPIGQCTCGCVFKNVNDISAWKYVKLVENSVFESEKAFISDKHASFIVNGDNASFKDVYNLIESIKNSVYYIYNIKLSNEVGVIDWR